MTALVDAFTRWWWGEDVAALRRACRGRVALGRVVQR